MIDALSYVATVDTSLSPELVYSSEIPSRAMFSQFSSHGALANLSWSGVPGKCPCPAAREVPVPDRERCAKVRFRTKLDARIALGLMPDVRWNGSGKPRQQSRAYFCPQCRGYHLTSRARQRKGDSPGQ
jgi:hypothetical protein